MLGAMIGLAIIFNVYNRVSNRRRRNKLRHSIFELPVYVYTASTRKRAKAARLARLQAQGEEGELFTPPLPPHDDDPRLRKRLGAGGVLEEECMVLPHGTYLHRNIDDSHTGLAHSWGRTHG